MPPTFLAAVGLGLRAAFREPWLLAVGMVVAFLRRAAVWPALAVGWAVLARSVVLALSRQPLSPRAPLEGVLAAVTAPRFLALVAGLWLAGIAAGAALRVAYLAGALPTLGAAQAGARGPRFATGVAFGFPRVLGAAALGLVADLSGGIFGGTLALAAARITVSASARGGSPLLAAAVALALVLAVAVPLALSVVADAAVARAAVRGDGPAGAFVEGGARFLARPGSFLLGAIVFGVLAALGPALVAGAGSVATGFASSASPVLLLGPELMFAAVSAAVAAGVDLVWLGTVAALACGEETQAGPPGSGTRAW
jgi:hypothetical protein